MPHDPCCNPTPSGRARGPPPVLSPHQTGALAGISFQDEPTRTTRVVADPAMVSTRWTFASLAVFGFVTVFHEADAIDWCEHPTGGSIPLVYSGCVQDTDRCFNWMNAKCVRGWCVCKDDECVLDGQCVAKGQCATVTGGTCALQGCDRWRNATCSESVTNNHEAHCVCGPGTCPIKGECRPPGTCAKDTGGSCNVLGCDAWRKATCSVTDVPGPTEKAKCMCGEGACPINGECVKKGGCPRYTGSGCKIFKTTGLFGCGAGECGEAAYCECAEDECFVDGKCVKADAAAIELSRHWGHAQEEAAQQSKEYAEANRALVLAFAASSSMVLGCVAIKKATRKEAASTPASDYEALED